jgi:hypothetical protein
MLACWREELLQAVTSTGWHSAGGRERDSHPAELSLLGSL